MTKASRLLIILITLIISAGLLTSVACASMYKAPKPKADLEVKTKGMVIEGAPFTLTVKAVDAEGNVVPDHDTSLILKVETGRLMHIVNNKKTPLGPVKFEKGKAEIKDVIILDGKRKNTIRAYTRSFSGTLNVRTIPGFLSILPPLLAIILALTMRQVIISLFCGIWLGAVFIYDFNPIMALMRTLDTILIKAVASEGHVSILAFDVILAGMVAIIARSGGSMGMVKVIRKWAKTAQTGQIATWAMGLLIFFDDYANTLIVGNSMRPLTDKLKISREKLSFLVDATAAPVTNIAIISTWIGFEIGVIGDSLRNIGIEREPYMVFVETIPYRFYPILMIVFVFMVGYLMRDFGPMLSAEVRTRETGEVLAPGAHPLSNIDERADEKKDVPERWFNAVVPIAAVICMTIFGLWYSGSQKILAEKGAEALANAKVYQILNNANSFRSLLWASFTGTLIIGIMVLVQRIMSLEEVLNTWVEGAKAIVPALIILVMAWAIGDICRELNTGSYVATIARGNLAPQLLPVVIFLLSAAISFATGTSWGTMSIVMPIAVYVGVYLPPSGMAQGLKESILLGSISGVLAGATFGDHCSPISDTTIMSSMASAADHIDHVRTQMPYALTVGAVCIFLGSVPTGYGLNPFISVALGAAALFLILRFIGKNPDEVAQTGALPLKEKDEHEKETRADSEEKETKEEG